MAQGDLFAALAVRLDATDAQVKFAILAGRFEDYSLVLGGAVLTTLREMEDIQFSTEGEQFGNKWPPLAPSTLDRKPAGLPMMVRTTRLRKSLTSRAEGSIANVSPFALEFGTSVPYAIYHQQPNGPGAGIIPLRQLIPQDNLGRLPDPVQEEIAENIRDYLIEGRIR